jgi:GTP cyclohydrolase I
MVECVRTLLECLGEDVEREGLQKTPARMSMALLALPAGYGPTAVGVVGDALFESSSTDMVLVRDIEINSRCEHHMLPFFGKAHIAYIPDGKIVGLSKIPRVVDAYARRLQVQERLTIEIRDCIQRTLAPLGVAVVVECAHMCMQMRGVQKQNSVTTTSAFTGIFMTNDATRKEFINLVQAKIH